MKKAMSSILCLVVSIGFALSLTTSAFAGPPPPALVTLGDFRGDGRADILVSGVVGAGTPQESNALWVLVTNATGDGPDSPNSGAIAFADVDFAV